MVKNYLPLIPLLNYKDLFANVNSFKFLSTICCGIELIKSLSTLIALEGEKLKMKQGEIKRLLNLLKLLDTLGIKDGDEVLESVDLDIKKRLKIEQVVKVLRFEPRIPLTMLSKKTNIPISSLFDYLNRIKENYDLRLVFIKRRS